MHKIKRFNCFVNEGKKQKIEYKLGKTYQSGNGWTVYKNDDEIHFSIDTNPSAGWQTDPQNTTQLRYMHSGNLIATYKLKSGNIYNQAKDMYNIATKDNTEYYGLSIDDYADIIRLYIDMQNHIL